MGAKLSFAAAQIVEINSPPVLFPILEQPAFFICAEAFVIREKISTAIVNYFPFCPLVVYTNYQQKFRLRIKINDCAFAPTFYLDAMFLASQIANSIVAMLLFFMNLKIEVLGGNQFANVTNKTTVQRKFVAVPGISSNFLQFVTGCLRDEELLANVFWNFWHSNLVSSIPSSISAWA